jgi:FkbM family methyltransferase
MSLRYRALRGVERVATTLMRIAQWMDLETLRKARFEALSTNSDIALADKAEKYLVFTADKTISKTVFATGEFEFGKFERVMRLLGGAFTLETLVDVGANIGTICIPAVARGFARRAIAIEPEPGNFRLLEINVRLNDLTGRIARYNVAAGPLDGQVLQMELSTVNYGDHRIRISVHDGAYREGSRHIVEVASQRLDTVVGALDAKSAIVWLDTQGFEGHVLRGADTIIAARVPLVLEFWPYGLNRTQSYADLRAAITSYATYYDLSDGDPMPRRTSDIDMLYRRLEETGGQTDILLV